MGTISKDKSGVGFAHRMFVSVVGIFLLLAVTFLVFQFQRETEYKVDILHNRLQVVNYQVANDSKDLKDFNDLKVSNDPKEIALLDGLRLTLFDLQGNVLFDNESDASKMSNHLDRKEIRQAIEKGSGYDIQRNSESMGGEMFFYSATLFRDKGVIVRSALPYNSQLYKDLAIDKTFIWLISITTIVLCIILYQIARRLAQTERTKVENEKHQLKRQLTQNAAHELKTPTASISAYLETILTTPDLSEENRRRFIERSYAQCQRMTNILSDMSALAKMDAVQQVKESVPINIRDLVEGIRDDIAPALAQAEMTLVNDVNATTVLGDRNLVYSIFRNLIDNAIAYAGRGKTITVTSTPSLLGDGKGEGPFSVSDNGIGVPKEHLSHLCERFYRIDKGRSRKLGGTGLGLAIVKNAVLLHDGEIELLQTPGGGLTVRFTLPCA